MYCYSVDNYLSDDYLAHYGIKGMKWGVRTRVYTKNKVGDYYTPKQKEKMTKLARKVLNKKLQNSNSMYETTKRSSNRAFTKGDTQRSEVLKKRAKSYLSSSKMYQQKLESIDSGKLKAGRDFVTNSVYSTNLPLDAIGFINLRQEHTVDFK